jgi:hypothetical protein
MSNNVFLNVEKAFCDKIKEIAKDSILVDCGAGLGLFASKYDGKVISIDIHTPEIRPFSPILEKNSLYYCFPKDSIPIFIRPCHSGFVQDTIITNLNKFKTVIYVSNPKNLETDLYLDTIKYSVNKVDGWEGDEGEVIYTIEIKQTEDFKYLQGRAIYFADPMLSFMVESIDQEFKEKIESPFETENILINGLNTRLMTSYPTNEKYDFLFFDYGGMSMGNSLMESFIRDIINDAEKYPNRCFVMTSMFTSYAMKDAIIDIGTNVPNIFLSMNSFISYYKKVY